MTADPSAVRRSALDALTAARSRTSALTDCVEDSELTAQHSPLMSPLVWDLAHISNQEEQWLLRAVAGREAMRPEIDSVYDAFEHPRASAPRCRCSSPPRRAATRRRYGAGSSTYWRAPRCTDGRWSTPGSPSA